MTGVAPVAFPIGPLQVANTLYLLDRFSLWLASSKANENAGLERDSQVK
jgi:hypothetical protein